jgi:hypothetical protein
MCYIDWSEAAQQTSRPPVHVIGISHVQSPALPVISPDGQWLTYVEGGPPGDRSSSARDAYVCALRETPVPALIKAQNGHIPRWIHNSPVPAVVYATCAWLDNPDLRIWANCGQTVKVPCPNGQPGTPEVLYAKGAFMSGLSYDGRYLATAENSRTAFILDLQSPSKAVYPTPVITQACDTLPSQACNSCISSSRIYTDVLLCLTVGGSHPALGSWKFHERLFLVDKDARVRRFFDRPAGLIEAASATAADSGKVYVCEWSGSEWSNHPYFAVAATKFRRVKGTIRDERAYAINLKDSTYLCLAQTTDTTALEMPGLWVDASGLTEAAGWLDNPIYTPVFPDSCRSVRCDTCPQDRPDCERGLCGMGACQALLLPFGLKIVAKSRRRKQLRASTHQRNSFSRGNQ